CATPAPRPAPTRRRRPRPPRRRPPPNHSRRPEPAPGGAKRPSAQSPAPHPAPPVRGPPRARSPAPTRAAPRPPPAAGPSPAPPAGPGPVPPPAGGPGPAPAAPRPPRRPRPLWARLLGRALAPWIGLKIEPEAPAEAIGDRLVCYVLEDYGLSNALILDRACQDAGLPSPLVPLPGDLLGRKRAYVALSRRNAGGALALATQLATQRKPEKKKSHSDSLARLLEAHHADPALDVQLVPVSIFVGRAPDKNSGWFSVLFSE